MKKLECKKCGYVNYVNDDENVFRCSLCGAKSKYPKSKNIDNGQTKDTKQNKHKESFYWITIGTTIYIYLIQFLYESNHISLSLLPALVIIPIYLASLFVVLKVKKPKHRFARIIAMTIVALLSLAAFMVEIFS